VLKFGVSTVYRPSLQIVVYVFAARSLFQVFLTPTHLAIVMEYAAGGELFERICNAGRFSEDEVCLFCSGRLLESLHFLAIEKIRVVASMLLNTFGSPALALSYQRT
jgi:hypothetical protein